jgi:hypothetical protein
MGYTIWVVSRGEWFKWGRTVTGQRDVGQTRGPESGS